VLVNNIHTPSLSVGIEAIIKNLITVLIYLPTVDGLPHNLFTPQSIAAVSSLFSRGLKGEFLYTIKL